MFGMEDNMRRILVTLLVFVFGCGAVWAADQATVPAIKAEIRNLSPFTYLCVEGKGPYTGIPAAEKTLLTAFASNRLKPSDKEITIYWNSPLYVKPEELLWDLGFPVAGNVKDVGGLKAKTFTFRKVAVATHVGSYLTTYVTINALYEWIARNNYQTVGGPCVERYFDAPDSTVPDAQKKTEIWVPIK